MHTATMQLGSGAATRDSRGCLLTQDRSFALCLPQRQAPIRVPARSHGPCRALPISAVPAALPASQQIAEILYSTPVAALPFGLPVFDVFAVFGFLLNNPVVTVALAVGVYVFVPRVWRWVLKRVLLPAGILLLLVFAAQHPTQSVLLGKSVLACTPFSGPRMPHGSRRCAESNNSAPPCSP